MKKVEILLHDEHPKLTSVDKSRVVIHLAFIELSNDATDVLAKGLNSAIAPKTIPKEAIISALETRYYVKRNILNQTYRRYYAPGGQRICNSCFGYSRLCC